MKTMNRAGFRIAWQLFFYGFGAIAAQTFLLRQGILWAGGNELVLGALFFFWFSGIAMGALAARKTVPSAAVFPFLSGLLPLWALGTMVCSVLVQAHFPPPAGAWPSFGRGMAQGLLLMLPPGAWIGFTFAAAARAAGGIARAFLWESLGSAAGGMAVTLMLVFRAPTFIVFAALGALGGLQLPQKGKAAALIPCLLVLFLGGRWDGMRWKGLNLAGAPLAQRESPYQSVMLARSGESTVFYLGGHYAGQFPDPERFDFRYRPFLAEGTRAGRVALVGEFPFESEEALLAPTVRDLIILQSDPYLFRMAAQFRRTPLDGRVHYVLSDPRVYFHRRGEPLDLIFVDAAAPVSILGNRLFTLEFFRTLRENMAPGGACVVFLPASENYWGREVGRMTRGIYQTLKAVFPHLTIAFGESPALVASGDRQGLSDDPPVLAGRARERGLENAAFHASIYAALFPAERIAYFRRRLDEETGPLNRDRMPFGYLHQLAVQEKVNGQIPLVGWILGFPRWGLLALIPPLLYFLPRRRRDLLQVFSTGFLSIGIFLLLSVSYQTAHGMLYSAMGLLTGLFMLGLACSAPAAAGIFRRQIPRWLPDAAAVLLLACLALLLKKADAPEVVFFAAMIASGFVLGLPFTFAGLHRGDGGAAAAQMETWDHLGAAAGALITGLVLLPLLGVYGVLMMLAGLKIYSGILNIQS